MFDRIFDARSTWQRAHGRWPAAVHVSSADAFELRRSVADREVFGEISSVVIGKSVAGMDWYEDPTLAAGAFRFEGSRSGVDVFATLDAIRRLDDALVDCKGKIARAIVNRAIAHLEADLRHHLTGKDRDA